MGPAFPRNPPLPGVRNFGHQAQRKGKPRGVFPRRVKTGGEGRAGEKRSGGTPGFRAGTSPEAPPDALNSAISPLPPPRRAALAPAVHPPDPAGLEACTPPLPAGPGARRGAGRGRGRGKGGGERPKGEVRPPAGRSGLGGHRTPGNLPGDERGLLQWLGSRARLVKFSLGVVLGPKPILVWDGRG